MPGRGLFHQRLRDLVLIILYMAAFPVNTLQPSKLPSITLIDTEPSSTTIVLKKPGKQNGSLMLVPAGVIRMIRRLASTCRPKAELIVIQLESGRV